VVVSAGQHGADATDEGTLATAFAVGKALKKNCVLVTDSPAFVVNRLLTRFLGEIIAAVDEGTPFQVAEGAPDPLGLPVPPFLLLQMVGPAVALHVAETLHQAFPDRFGVSPKLRALVAAGRTAVYGPDFTVDQQVAEILAGGERPSTAEQVRERALEALTEEIRLMLDEGVVTAPQDIDLCMILGAGWPFHLGGITPYLDSSGIAEKVTGTRFHL
jgi:3-hydroxyacyl-CoA dehydrogenase